MGLAFLSWPPGWPEPDTVRCVSGLAEVGAGSIRVNPAVWPGVLAYGWQRRDVDQQAEAEFEQFVRDRASVLLRVALLVTGDVHAAEDLLQATSAKTFVAWRGLQRRQAADAYVRRVLVNTQTSWWRRRRFRKGAGIKGSLRKARNSVLRRRFAAREACSFRSMIATWSSPFRACRDTPPSPCRDRSRSG